MGNLIELTETWAAKITICSSGETLGIEGDNREVERACAVVQAGQKVVSDWSPDSSAGDVDSNFRNWNGGCHCRATYRAYGVAAELYSRELEEDDEGERAYSGWSLAGLEDTPQILQDGMAIIVGSASEAMSAARREIEARDAAFEAEFDDDESDE